jgi:hypothetical protein
MVKNIPIINRVNQSIHVKENTLKKWFKPVFQQ